MGGEGDRDGMIRRYATTYTRFKSPGGVLYLGFSIDGAAVFTAMRTGENLFREARVRPGRDRVVASEHDAEQRYIGTA